MASLKVKIKVPRHLAARSALRPITRWRGLTCYVPFFAWRFGLFVLAVTVLDGTLPPRRHSEAFLYTGLSFIGACVIVEYVKFVKKAKSGGTDYEYDAEVTDDGVIVTYPERKDETPWSTFSGYHDQEDALEIWWKNGACSYVPKNDETRSVIEFTKSKLPSYLPVDVRSMPTENHSGKDREEHHFR